MRAPAARFLAVLVLLAAVAARAGEVRLVVQDGHVERVTCAAFSPDGRLLATGARDGTARIWDLASGRLVRRIAGHPHGVSALAFSADGLRLATGAEDARARLFDLADGREIRRFHGHLPHVEIAHRGTGWPERGRVTAIALDPDGRRLLTAGNDGTARIWDVATGHEIRQLEGHVNRVFVAAFIDGGARILTAGQDGTARLWDAAGGDEIRKFAIRREVGLAQWIMAADLSPDGKRLVTGSADGVTRIWEAATGREMLRMAGEKEAVNALRVSDDGLSVLAGAADGTVRRYDLDVGEETAAWTGASVLAISRDGTRVAMTPERREAEVRDAVAGGHPVRLRGRAVPVRSGVFSPDGRRLLLGLEDGSIAIHDLTANRVEGIGGLPGAVTAMAVSPDASLIVAGGEDGRIRFLRRDQSEAEDAPTSGVAGRGEVVALALNEDVGILVSACSDGSVWTWRTSPAERRDRFRLHRGRVSDVAIDREGRRFAVAVGRWVEIFDVLTGVAVAECEGHFAEVTSVRFAEDGRTLITGSAEGSVRLWSAEDGTLVHRFDGILNEVVGAVLPLGGGRVVAADEDGTVHLWDAETTASSRRIETEIGAARSLLLSPDGTTLLLLGARAEVVMVDLRAGREVGRILHTAARSRAVVGVDGRYDLSEPAASGGLHWRIGTAIVTLPQLAPRYRTPGLLASLLGRSEAIVAGIVPIQELGPPPTVRIEPLDPGGGTLRYRVIDRGGGLGSTVVRIDGRGIISPPSKDPASVDLTDLGAGPGSRIEISAYGEGDHVRGPTQVIIVGRR